MVSDSSSSSSKSSKGSNSSRSSVLYVTPYASKHLGQAMGTKKGGLRYEVLGTVD